MVALELWYDMDGGERRKKAVMEKYEWNGIGWIGGYDEEAKKAKHSNIFSRFCFSSIIAVFYTFSIVFFYSSVCWYFFSFWLWVSLP